MNSGYWQKNFSVTLPLQLLNDLDEINKIAEKNSDLSIGRSFIIRYALEELLKRENPKDLIVERKIDSLRTRMMV